MYGPARVRVAATQCAAMLLMALVEVCGHSQATEDRLAATSSGGRFVLQNRTIKTSGSTTGGKLSGLSVVDFRNVTELPIEKPFELLLKNGAIYDPGNLQIYGEAKLLELTPHPGASRLAERISGR